MKKKYLFSIICALFFFVGTAQEAFVSSGQTYVKSQGKISFSVGQIAVSFLKHSNGSLSEGVQQGDIHVENILTEMPNLNISVYPNPVANDLFISIEEQSSDDYYYYVYTSNGVLLEENVCSNANRISFANYSGGLYFVKIVERESNLINQYRIIKQ
ncbi:MAG: T9SS type A sorting domain-containing protein [Bacteroidota bacterium]